MLSTRAILGKIDSHTASRLSYAYESWFFHYIAEDGLVFLAVSDADSGRRVSFAFLAQLQKEYNAMPPSANTQPKLDALRAQFNQSPDSDPIRRAQSES
ncbi:hypothetical protein MVES_003416 [Malassezia vespertilionis]|uniref:Longin domain-containing protein n=1 Tax=Malassezia vespertilionis TaxID=2020962 RepID=A0A2N1J7R6_9BASI|nr:hypothetical protein MVES_003416 [Malassezia vespertilionis]